jgi:light-regulated signal transduction histidine kinase (bacteriophytochrome)
MQELIDDILAWSRAGSAQLEITRVDSGELVRDVEASLAPAIAEAGATIEADGLPTIRADRAQLRQVFQNLMANAIKFHGDDPPRVVVTGEETTDGWRFSIADNGIGVDPKYAERIFEMFSRLHGRDAYPGTGVGLAICATVVEKHGGRIWVEPTPGGGSTFRFTVRGSMPG